MRFEVELQDLRAALIAVLPHTPASNDDRPALTRLRFWPGPVNLTVGATDAYTMGLAVVSADLYDDSDVVDHSTGEVDLPTFDLHPDEVKKILAVHRRRKVGGEDVEQRIMFDVSAESVVTSDVSGLFAGDESLSVPRVEDEEHFPGLPGYLGSLVRRAETGTTYAAEPLGVGATALAAFVTAAKAYGQRPILRVVETVEGRFIVLVAVGDSFIGVLTTHTLTAESDDSYPWPAWEARLPDRAEAFVTALATAASEASSADVQVEVVTSPAGPALRAVEDGDDE